MPSDLPKRHLGNLALASRIEKIGEEMAPCDSCRRHKRRCVAASPESARCAECVRTRKGNCNFTAKLPTVNDWASLDRQRQKLRDEEEVVMAKILRLRKQQRFLDEREKEMVRRGVETLEELDQVEAAEKAELARQEASAQALTDASSSLEDPSTDPEVFADLPDSFWTGIGFSGVATGPSDAGWGGELVAGGTLQGDPS